MKHELLQEAVEDAVQQALYEFRKKDASIELHGKRHSFGSDEHVLDMKRTLRGLERVRDCFEVGSGNRQTYSQACSRLRRLIRNLEASRKPATQTE